MSLDEIIGMMRQHSTSISRIATEFGERHLAFKNGINERFYNIHSLILVLKNKIKLLRPGIEDSKRELQLIKSELEKNSQELGQCRANQARITTQLRELENTNLQLNAQHDTAIAQLNAQHQSEIAQLRKDLTAATANLDKTISDKDAELARLNSQYENRLTDLQRKYDTDNEALRNATIKENKGLSDMRDKLTQENQQLTQANQQLTQANQQLTETRQVIAGELNTLQVELQKLLAFLGRQYTDLDEKDEDTTRQFQAIEDELNELLTSFDKSFSGAPSSGDLDVSALRPPLPPPSASAKQSFKLPTDIGPLGASAAQLPPPPPSASQPVSASASRPVSASASVPLKQVINLEQSYKGFLNPSNSLAKNQVEQYVSKNPSSKIATTYNNFEKQLNLKLNTEKDRIKNERDKIETYRVFYTAWDDTKPIFEYKRGGNRPKIQKNKKTQKRNNMRIKRQKTNKKQYKRNKSNSKRGGWVYKSNERLDSQSSEITTNSESDSKSRTNSNVKGKGLRKTKKRHSHYKSKAKSRSHKMQ